MFPYNRRQRYDILSEEDQDSTRTGPRETQALLSLRIPHNRPDYSAHLSWTPVKMCLPCWTDIVLEEEPQLKKKKEILYWDPRAGGWVKITGTKVPPIYPPPQPVVYNQPYIGPPQPIYQPQYQMPIPMQYQQPLQITPQPYNNGYPAFNIGYQGPAWGQSPNEILAGQVNLAQQSDINKKQEMKPADDDPFRMYWCRELDGTWTQRNRLTIDSGDIGDCRWYAMDGQFYVVRLTDG